MGTSQADGGTRSGLLWEVERILNELNSNTHTHTQSSTLPQVLLMENVPEVIGVGNVQHFNKWLDKLESLGYTNHFQILNGKDYGIPQNRRRVFMVSILGDYAYDFPIKLKLKYRLKDFLEKQVDEKYYLSDKMIEFFTYNNEKQKESGNGFKSETISADDDQASAKTITTRNGSRMDDNFVADKGCEQVGNMGYYNHEQSDRVYGAQPCAPTLRTGYDDAKAIKVLVDKRERENGMAIKENTKQGYKIAKPGDGVNLANRMKHQRGNVQRGSIQTLKTEMEVGVVVDERENKS
ncbi:MAG: DNA cytosine methyltransferase [Methanobrevibacter sp.]|nr:DNA cytosine methyltransferase [Methanobrevibacter sp.]